MIKNKKAIYILLPVVLVVWGLIFYKVLHAVHTSDSSINFTLSQASFSAGDSSLVDTFNISGNYRDPFLGKTYSEANPAVKREIKPSPIKPVMKWPVIRYTGIVKNEKNGRQLVMIRINGTNKFMQAGDEALGVELTKVFKDSVEVKFLKEKKVFIK